MNSEWRHCCVWKFMQFKDAWNCTVQEFVANLCKQNGCLISFWGFLLGIIYHWGGWRVFFWLAPCFSTDYNLYPTNICFSFKINNEKLSEVRPRDFAILKISQNHQFKFRNVVIHNNRSFSKQITAL